MSSHGFFANPLSKTHLKILVTAPMDPSGLDLLKGVPGLDVDLKSDISLQELLERISEYHILIAGTTTPIDREALEKAKRLQLIGWIGSGRPCFDLNMATRKGVLVMNAPGSVVSSAAELAVSLILALARRIPEADFSVKKGVWYERRLMGVEVRNKILGIIGFGSVGTLVAERMKGMKMNVVVHDPYLSSEAIQRFGCRKVTREELFAVSDMISIHVPLNQETQGMISEKSISLMKSGVMLVNCSASGVVDEDALYEGIINGKVAAAALDLHEEQPIEEHPLYLSEKVICTPNLSVYTQEALVEVSLQIARQIKDYLENGNITHAMNLPEAEGSVTGRGRSWTGIGESMGRFVIQLHPFGLKGIEIELAGEDETLPAETITRSVLKGILGQIIAEPVNLVNSKSLAEERGVRITEKRQSAAENFRVLITVTVVTDQEKGMISGTLFDGLHPRIVRVDGFELEVVPDGDFLVIFNRDRPGVIADVGECLGRYDINIGQMYNGRDTIGGKAITLLRIDSVVPENVLNEIRRLPNILSATWVNMAAQG